MEQIFANGTYRGQGHWIDQKTEGGYTAQYKIVSGQDGSKVHEVERIFLKPDRSIAYEERSIVTFKPTARSGVVVTIHGAQSDVTGPGYAFDCECHYDIDVTPDNHLEFTFHSEGARITGLGSATNRGNHTYWRESLDRL